MDKRQRSRPVFRNIVRQPWMLIGGALLLTTIAVLFAERLQKPAYQTRLQQLGYPSTIAEIEQAYFERTSDKGLAAYGAAIAAFKEPPERVERPEDLDTPSFITRISELEPNQAIPEDLLNEIRDFCTMNEQALQWTYEAAKYQNVRFIRSFEGGYFSANLDESSIWKLRWLLHIDMLRKSVTGDSAGATNAVTAWLDVADVLVDDPFLTHQLSHARLVSDASASVERLLNRIELRPADLFQLERRFAPYRETLLPEFRRAIANEIVGVLESEFLARERPRDSDEFPRGAAVPLWHATGFAAFNRARYARAMIPALTDELSDSLGQPNEYAKSYEPHLRALLFMDVSPPPVERILHVVRSGVAYAEIARTLIALECYRLDHGGFPESLDALVPQYLDAVPADPFAESGPLRYRREPDRVIVYSVYVNGADDQGQDLDYPDGDLPLTLYLPAYRPRQ